MRNVPIAPGYGNTKNITLKKFSPEKKISVPKSLSSDLRTGSGKWEKSTAGKRILQNS